MNKFGKRVHCYPKTVHSELLPLVYYKYLYLDYNYLSVENKPKSIYYLNSQLKFVVTLANEKFKIKFHYLFEYSNFYQ